MTKQQLIDTITQKCLEEKNLTEEQSEIVRCFVGLANLNNPNPMRESDIGFEEPSLSKEQEIRSLVKWFIDTHAHEHLYNIFGGDKHGKS